MPEQILLMTRPRAASERFVAGLDAQALVGVQVVFAPLIEIAQTAKPSAMGGYNGVIFTSANGVDFAPDGGGKAAYCVGERTGKSAKARGWDVKTVQLDADALVSQMAEDGIKGPLAHLSGTHRRGDIAERLMALGTQVDVHVLYDQRLHPLTNEAHHALAGEVPVILPLFSPRSAAHLAEQVAAPFDVTVIAISEAVAREVKSTPFQKVVVVPKPTGQEMKRSIEKLLRNNRLS